MSRAWKPSTFIFSTSNLTWQEVRSVFPTCVESYWYHGGVVVGFGRTCSGGGSVAGRVLGPHAPAAGGSGTGLGVVRSGGDCTGPVPGPELRGEPTVAGGIGRLGSVPGPLGIRRPVSPGGPGDQYHCSRRRPSGGRLGGFGAVQHGLVGPAFQESGSGDLSGQLSQDPALQGGPKRGRRAAGGCGRGMAALFSPVGRAFFGRRILLRPPPAPEAGSSRRRDPDGVGRDPGTGLGQPASPRRRSCPDPGIGEVGTSAGRISGTSEGASGGGRPLGTEGRGRKEKKANLCLAAPAAPWVPGIIGLLGDSSTP